MKNAPRQSWMAAESERLQRERDTMHAVAPDMTWLDDAPAGGWEGFVPQWPLPRPAPDGLDDLLAGRRLLLRVTYKQAFPAIEPILTPIDPEPDISRRVDHDWHINGDGSLCLLRDADLWTGRETAADLVVKAAGWFVEFLLLEQGAIPAMTENGIHTDDSVDQVIEALAA